MKKYILMLLSAALFTCCSSDNDSEIVENQSIFLDAELVEFDGDGNVIMGKNSVTVTSSAEWRLTGDTSWCTPSVEKGDNGTTVTFNVTTSDSEDSRKVNLVFICGNAATKLAIRQVPNPVVEYIKIEDSYTFDATGGNITMQFSTNLESFDYEASEKWVSLFYYPENNDSPVKWAQFVVEPNPTFFDREATITLFKGTVLEKTVTVNQDRYVGVLIEGETDLEFDVNGGTATVKAIGNVDFNPSITTANAAWISAVEKSSEGTDIITKVYTITCEPTEYFREGVVTLKAASGTSATLNIIQENPNSVLFDVPDSYFSDRLIALGYVREKNGKYDLTYSGYMTTSISLNYYYNMASLEGIEKFVNLTSLASSYSSVRELDLTKNTKITSLTLSNLPLEVLKLGDLDITTRTMNNAFYNNSATGGAYAKSFTISSSKLTSLTMNHTTTSSYDKMEWVDITGCPALTTLSCNRNSGNLKSIYVTQAQKDAYDAGTLKITTNASLSVEIVVK